MKIMHAIGGETFGGAESHFVRLVCALHHSGLAQHVVMRHHPQRMATLRAAGVTVTEAPFQGFLDAKTRDILKQEAKMFAPDIVQSWMFQASRMMPVGDYIRLGWLRGFHHLEDYRYCDHLCALTKGIVSSIVAQGWPSERIHQVRPFAEAKVGKKLPKSTYKTPEEAPVILGLGRLHWHKSFDTVIQVLTQIPEAYFWLAGEGEQRTDLENFAKSIGVFDRVRFLGWHEDQADLYATADICVLPSRYEPFGLVMIEAWAHQIPLVATRAAGPRATAQDMVDALLVPIDDVDAFAEAIRRILTDDVLRASLVANGFNHYKQDYTVESTVAQYHRLYQDILDQGPMIHRGLSRLGQIKDSLLALFLSK